MEADDRIGRARQAASDAALSRVAPPAPGQDGSLVCKTVSLGAYPTTARAYYAVQRELAGGDEVEGGSATLTVVGAPFFAANLGGSVPAVGTDVRVDLVDGGRFAFRYG